MRIPGLKTARKSILLLKNRANPGAIILGYHRIAQVEKDSFYNHVSPENFSQQMEVLQQYAHPISLDALIERLEKNEALSNCVCVTLDDGYADALWEAKPILEKYNIPATVFVTAGNLGGEFWWDELERIIFSAPTIEKIFHLDTGIRTLVLKFSDPGIKSRTHMINVVADSLRPTNPEKRRQLLDEMNGWFTNQQPENERNPRSLQPYELRTLREGGLIRIGSHSVTHPMLSEQSPQDRHYEIYESKQILEDILAEPISGFSYPNGSYLESDISLVEEAGYRYACISQNGAVASTTHPYKLPRFWSKNIDGISFQRWLKMWL